MKRLDKVIRLRAADWLELAAIALIAARVEFGLRSGGLNRLAGRLKIALVAEDGDAATAASPADGLPTWAVHRLRLVRAAMRYWPFGDSCLRVALVSGQRIHSLGPKVVIGVACADGVIKAHAWLAVGDRTLDPLAQASFKPLRPMPS